MQVNWGSSAFSSTPLYSDFGSTTLIRLSELKTAVEERLVVEHTLDYSIAGAAAVSEHKAGECSVVNIIARSSLSYVPTYYGALAYTNNADGLDAGGPGLWFDTGVGLVALGVTTHAGLANLTDDGLQSTIPYFAHLALQAVGQKYSYALASVSGTSGNNYITGTGFLGVVNVHDIIYIPNANHQKLQAVAVSNTQITFAATDLVTASFGPVTCYGYRELYMSKNWVNPVANIDMGTNQVTGLPTSVATYTTPAALADAHADDLVVSNDGHPNGAAFTVHPNLSMSVGTAKFGGDKLVGYKTPITQVSSLPADPTSTPIIVNFGWFSFWPTVSGNSSAYELHPEYVGVATDLDTPSVNSPLSSYWSGASFSIVCIASGGGTLEAYSLSTGNT